MSKKPETLFREKVIDDLRTIPKCKHFSIQQVTIVATPDLLLCINGVFVALELKKSEKERVPKMQLYNLEQVEKAGGKGWVVYPQNWKQVLLRLRMIGSGEHHKEGFLV